jgi:plastocyanin
MPGTATKQKKAAAPASAPTSTAPVPITVAGGEPDPDSVTVSAGTRVQFTNDDEVCYLIQMTTKNGGAPGVDVVLPALASVSVVAAATLQQRTAEYQLTALPQSRTRGKNDLSGGGGRIIVNP